jgi:hypothetical protein
VSNLVITQGEDFDPTYRWANEPWIYKPIAAVTALTPLTMTVTGHGLTEGYPVAIAELPGLDALQAGAWPPEASQWYEVHVVDVNTVQLNSVDAARLGGAYTSGGMLGWLTPAFAAGMTAELNIYSSPPITPAPPFPTPPWPPYEPVPPVPTPPVPVPPTPLYSIAGIVDVSGQTVNFPVAASVLALYIFGNGYFQVVITDSGGAKFLIDSGGISIGWSAA